MTKVILVLVLGLGAITKTLKSLATAARSVALLIAFTASANAAGSAGPRDAYKDVAFIGDSITQFWPFEDFFPGAMNEGIGGQMSWNMAGRFQNDVIDKHPRVVVILCGTNDIRYDLSYNPYFLFKMVEAAAAAGIKVIVGTLPANTGWAPGSESVAAPLYPVWDKAVEAGAKVYGYTIVDYRAATTLLDGLQNKALYQSDGTHPNLLGYEALSNALRPILNKER